MSISNLLFSVANLEKPVYRVDSSGAEIIDHYQLVYTDLPCNIQPLAAKQIEYYFERGIEVDTEIFVDIVQEYGMDWRIISRNNVYNIKGIRNLIDLDRVIGLLTRYYPTPTRKI